VSSFEHVLVSAGNNWSGDITEGKEVSDWIGIGSLVCEVMGILEYVFVRIRKLLSSSEDEKLQKRS